MQRLTTRLITQEIEENSIEINNQTSSERITEFMQNIINYENINENAYYLIVNSSNQLRTYLHNLLINLKKQSIKFKV